MTKDKQDHATKEYYSQSFQLTPEDNHCLLLLCGQHNEQLKFIGKQLSVNIANRGHRFLIEGIDIKSIEKSKKILQILYKELIASPNKQPISTQKIYLMLQKNPSSIKKIPLIHTQKGKIKSYNRHQSEYICNIQNHSLNFAIGPAGTGKTFLAVACAVYALKKQQIQRIILVRPAVEAGEKLGFLPGNIVEKIDPYLRPLYDALFELLGVDYVNKQLANGVIEIAPLAYMRGRTLHDAFVILDEGQNTTREQMKMFLTRIGFGSTAVVTGDISQIDLPKKQRSGLVDAIQILGHIKTISFSYFEAKDTIRHPIVEDIIKAYEKHQREQHES